jgi:hypothetical protein
LLGGSVAIFLFVSLALSVIPAIQNNYTEPIIATAQTVDTELSTEQKRLINQTASRIVNANPDFVGNVTIPSLAATSIITALVQVIERIVVQTSNPDQIITHIAIEAGANPTGPLSQGLLVFGKQLVVGDTIGVNQLASLVAKLTESPAVNATTTQVEGITGNISQLILQQAFQSALGTNQLLNQIASKLAANSSKLSVNNVTISADAIAQTIHNIIIQVSLQQQVSLQPLLYIANQVNQNQLGPLSKSIIQLAQLQATGGVGASQSIAQSISELVKEIISSATGNVPTTEPTSEDEVQDRRTKIIIRDEFDERDPPESQPPPEQPPQQFQDNQSLIVPITNESTLLPPPPTNATSPEDEILPQTPTPIDTNQTVQLRVIREVINDNGGTRAAEDLGINLVDSRGESVYPLSPVAPAQNERIFDLAVGTYYLQAGGFEYLAIFEGDCDSTGKITIVADGINKSCTVKFDDRIIGAVKFVTDVINDDGGNKTARDFQFDLIRAGGLLVTIRGAPPPDGETWTTPSDYTIIPSAVSGYTTSLEGDCTNVLVVENQTKTCTIVNDDIAGAELRVITQVINDNSGNKTAEDFRIFILDANETFTPGLIPAVPPPHGTVLDKRPGTYLIVGSSLGNYGTAFQGDCDSTGRVTLVADGPAKSCTIIINDVEGAQLKVITEVINDNGGNKTAEDFSIRIFNANATTSVSAIRTGLAAGPLPGALPPDGTIFALAPGTYVVVGSPLVNYGITFEGDCDSRAIVTLAADGPAKSCTVKFDDRLPGLVKAKIVTDVINDNGGNKTARDFRFDIVTPTFLFSGATSAPPPDGRTYNTPTFSYTIIPRADPGYTTTLEGDCTNVLVVENQTKTCTIVNDDILGDDGLLSPQPPTPVTGNQTNATLILNIRVINDDGVSIQPQDLGTTVDVFGNNFRNPVVTQIPASNGSSNTFSVQPGSYTINFSPGRWIAYFLGNYSFGNTCRGPQVLGAGDTKTCFTTFNDIGQPTNGSQPARTGTLSIRTHVINDNTNSTLEASDVFMLLVMGQIQQLFIGSEDRKTFSLPADTQYFVIPEQQVSHTSSRSGDCGGLGLLGGNTTTILAGEIKSCTITLDDRGGSAQIFSTGNRTLQNLTRFPTTTSEKETICDDGIDNDNDVKVDAADEDCLLITSTTAPSENATTTLPSSETVQTPSQAQELQPDNNPPNADAGEDSSVESGKTVKLNGEGSNDPDANQELSYLWKQVSPGSPSVSLDGEEEEVASFKAPEVDEDTKFKFELTVKDEKGGEDTDTATVAVFAIAEEQQEKEQEKEDESQQPETTSEQVEKEQEQQDESP